MNRRNFLKASMAVAATATVSGSGTVFATSSTAGILYSEQSEGKWAGKKGSHAPMIHVNGSEVQVTTKHGMAPRHYIVRHTLVGADGTVFGSKTYPPIDGQPTSTFALPAGYKGKLTATSFCSLHDLWITETNV